MMTRKDYDTIAACFKAERQAWAGSRDDGGPVSAAALRALRSLECRLTLELELDNPRFDRRTFAAASGVDKVA